jgi:hypothetical protein
MQRNCGPKGNECRDNELALNGSTTTTDFCLSLSTSTVKASNLTPHGNFGLFVTSSVTSLDVSCTKNEQDRICRSKVFLQLLFSSFFCRTRFNDRRPSGKKSPKFRLEKEILTLIGSLLLEKYLKQAQRRSPLQFRRCRAVQPRVRPRRRQHKVLAPLHPI